MWTKFCDVKVDILDTADIRFSHEDLNIIAKSDAVERELNISNVDQGFAGVYFRDGVYIETYGPDQYMFWKNMNSA
jgi:hypothetical protein